VVVVWDPGVAATIGQGLTTRVAVAVLVDFVSRCFEVRLATEAERFAFSEGSAIVGSRDVAMNDNREGRVLGKYARSNREAIRVAGGSVSI
jgi:hypothetical protein